MKTKANPEQKVVVTESVTPLTVSRLMGGAKFLVPLDRMVAEAAQRIMSGGVRFSVPGAGAVTIKTLDDYLAWCQTMQRYMDDPGADGYTAEAVE